ncbi:hypothetical protein GCM10028805_47170 [Spirosoma harenae]
MGFFIEKHIEKQDGQQTDNQGDQDEFGASGMSNHPGDQALHVGWFVVRIHDFAG